MAKRKIITAFLFVSTSLQAQTTTTTSLDPGPIVSPRAHGMGGALSTNADGIDALYYNPAAIDGHIYQGREEKKPFVRQLFFPRAGVTANANASSLYQESSSNGSMTDAQKGAATVKAHEGKRQFTRASIVPLGLFLGKMGVAPIMDQQIAAVPQNTDNSDVEFRFRSFSGVMYGTSITDPKGFLSLGVSGTSGTLEETYATAPYTEMVDVDARNEIFNQHRKKFAVSSQNVGLIIRSPHKISPSFSLVSRDMGSPKYTASDGSTLKVQEDVTAGFGVSPKIGRWMRLNIGIEGQYLTQRSIAASKKIKAGGELLIGTSEGSRALLGVRGGYTSAGATFGAHLNLGLIGIEASSHAIDIGVNNERFIERRTSISAHVDVASF